MPFYRVYYIDISKRYNTHLFIPYINYGYAFKLIYFFIDDNNINFF